MAFTLAPRLFIELPEYITAISVPIIYVIDLYSKKLSTAFRYNQWRTFDMDFCSDTAHLSGFSTGKCRAIGVFCVTVQFRLGLRFMPRNYSLLIRE
jgi:hypothetical protein